MCAELARRGWRITLLDAASGPAQAASALPVGMLSPHVTRAPTALSRLSGLGVTDTRAELERLVVQGQGWQACEVDNLGHAPGRWPAALVRPAALVEAWLAQAQKSGALTTCWNAEVSRLSPHSTGSASAERRPAPGLDWQALDPEGRVIAQASTVVVTAAYGSLSLLAASATGLDLHTLPLRPVKGQMSLGPLNGPALAERPQRDNGVFVPAYEDRGLPPAWPARIWAMGSTYERGDASTGLSNAAHERNAQSLEALNPEAAKRLREAAAEGTLTGWAQVRCASLDRLPLVGAVPDVPALQRLMVQAGARRGRIPLDDAPRWPGLFLLGALGSRGLTLAHWCAALLASRIDGEPVDVAPDLLRAIDPARFAWKQARRQPVPSDV